MGSSKPKAVQTPFQQQQQQTNTYAPLSIRDTREAQEFLDTPLDFGDPTNVDPGVGRRTDLAEQEVGNRYDSAFNAGIPAWIREMNKAKEIRDVRGQGAYEAQQAQFFNQQGNNEMRRAKTLTELQRRQSLLPQFYQTGGSGSTSGFNTQIVQPQPGFWQRALLAGISGGAQVASAYAGRG